MPTCMAATPSSIAQATSCRSISASWAASTRTRAATSPSFWSPSCAATIARWPRCSSAPATCRPTSRARCSPRPAARSASRSSASPAIEISIARLLAQLLRVTEQFEMTVQPQLLLLQKTMLMAEGMGTRLNPKVNIWELARPLIEEWMQSHFGPRATIGRAAEDVMRGPAPPAAPDRQPASRGRARAPQGRARRSRAAAHPRPRLAPGLRRDHRRPRPDRRHRRVVALATTWH